MDRKNAACNEGLRKTVKENELLSIIMEADERTIMISDSEYYKQWILRWDEIKRFYMTNTTFETQIGVIRL